MSQEKKATSETLTSRQRELLEYIENSLQREQHVPSYREMAKAMGVSAVGTIQDHVKQLIEKGYLVQEGRKIKLSERLATPMISVPIVGTVAAGPMTDTFEVSQGTLPLSIGELGSRYATRKLQSDSFMALQISGESMIEAGILPGDYVVVDRKAHVKDRDVVVVAQRGEATVKEVEFAKGKPYRLHPKNASMKPFLIEESEDVKILGKVVALHRYMN